MPLGMCFWETVTSQGGAGLGAWAARQQADPRQKRGDFCDGHCPPLILCIPVSRGCRNGDRSLQF